MSDIDLIPQDYRNRLLLQSRVKHQALWLAAMAVLAVAVFSVLGYLGSQARQEIAELQRQQAITTQQRDTLTQLNEQKLTLDNRLVLLSGLRSGASAPAMFMTIDRALTGGEVWFEDWQFQRAGAAVREPAEPASNGYFIIMPASGENSAEAWKIETHMTIRGQARDHSALSRFVRRLFEQPEIADIRILNTSLATNRKFVNFNLAVTVDSSGASG